MITIRTSEKIQYDLYRINNKYKGFELLPRQVIVCKDTERDL